MNTAEIDSIKKYQKYFKRLVEIEREEEMSTQLNEILLFSGKKREQKGRAILDLNGFDAGTGIGGTHLVRLKAKGTLPKTEISIGDLVICSSTNPPNGKEPQAVVVEKSKRFIKIAYSSYPPSDVFKVNVRLDLFANDVTFQRMKEALSHLKDRQIISDLLLGKRKPRLLDEDEVPEIQFENNALNEYQQEAVQKSIEAEDLFVLHGPPGTGKTTTLIESIIQHVKIGKYVLATADSNIAVDNMLERLMQYKIPVVRIGNPVRIQEELQATSLEYQLQNNEKFQTSASHWSSIQDLRQEQKRFIVANGQNRRGLSDGEIMAAAKRDSAARGIPKDRIRKMAQWLNLQKKINVLMEEAQSLEGKAIQEVLSNAKVICATNSTAGSDLLKDFRFSVAVIDEASQSMEPSCLIPMVRTKKWILAGDHKQLPPTILSKDARALNLTLFERWVNLYPEHSYVIRQQYRMNEQIMKFSNEQFYKGELVADDSVKKQKLSDYTGFSFQHANNYSGLLYSNDPVHCIAINETGETKRSGGYSYMNKTEAKAVSEIITALTACRVFPQDIGVISPYDAQVQHIKDVMGDSGVEVKSVDGFQGREKEVMIISFVRSNENGDIGFLSDYRRLNVALTRAKKKMFLVGDPETLCQHSVYKEMWEGI